MYSTHNLFTGDFETIEETSGQQIAAGIAGFVGLQVGTGTMFGQLMHGMEYDQIYQLLQDKVEKNNLLKESGSDTAKLLVATIPVVGSIVTVSEQRKLDRLKGDIGKVLEKKEMQEIIKLRQKTQNGQQLTKKELDNLKKAGEIGFKGIKKAEELREEYIAEKTTPKKLSEDEDKENEEHEENTKKEKQKNQNAQRSLNHF